MVLSDGSGFAEKEVLKYLPENQTTTTTNYPFLMRHHSSS